MEFTEEEIRDVFKLLSAVLQMGNIEFMTAGGAQITSNGGKRDCSGRGVAQNESYTQPQSESRDLRDTYMANRRFQFFILISPYNFLERLFVCNLVPISPGETGQMNMLSLHFSSSLNSQLIHVNLGLKLGPLKGNSRVPIRLI